MTDRRGFRRVLERYQVVAVAIAVVVLLVRLADGTFVADDGATDPATVPVPVATAPPSPTDPGTPAP